MKKTLALNALPSQSEQCANLLSSLLIPALFLFAVNGFLALSGDVSGIVQTVLFMTAGSIGTIGATAMETKQLMTAKKYNFGCDAESTKNKAFKRDKGLIALYFITSVVSQVVGFTAPKTFQLVASTASIMSLATLPSTRKGVHHVLTFKCNKMTSKTTLSFSNFCAGATGMLGGSFLYNQHNTASAVSYLANSAIGIGFTLSTLCRYSSTSSTPFRLKATGIALGFLGLSYAISSTASHQKNPILLISASSQAIAAFGYGSYFLLTCNSKNEQRTMGPPTSETPLIP